ncbi:MAG: metal-dependent hydrolase [Methanoregula sp.]|jgi:hypothetical protein|uniref:metal-dependent hydrolase n=1 Tax=Methanoregula sp. TaxID=2052170 RepID=UPI003D0EC74A
MNRQVHIGIGVVLFLAYAYFTGNLHTATGGFFVYGIVAVVVGSLFPDILEPPSSGRHRRIFHSWRALKFSMVMFLLTAMLVIFAPGISHFLVVSGSSCFFLGYSAHLLADSTTRAGLPR